MGRGGLSGASGLHCQAPIEVGPRPLDQVMRLNFEAYGQSATRKKFAQ